MKKNLEIISLIYKSTKYLKFIYDELNENYCNVPGWDISARIVGNDPTPEVETLLNTLDIKSDVYNDHEPNDYYLNRVYRCWNWAGRSSTADNICFVNSDMAFSNGWLINLLKYHDGINIPCSRLVESGKLPSGLYGKGVNLGTTTDSFNKELWLNSAEVSKKDEVHPNGLYMPCIFETKRFIESGGYPEGNIYQDGVGTLNGFIKSGDDYYFHDILENKYGMKHATVFDSLVYHIQEGEKDE